MSIISAVPPAPVVTDPTDRPPRTKINFSLAAPGVRALGGVSDLRAAVSEEVAADTAPPSDSMIISSR
jgi:hypothetical protein